MAYVSGKVASVTVGTNAVCFDEWAVRFSSKLPVVTNFCSLGYQELLSGILSATVTLKGPYNLSSMALCAGSAYSFTLSWNGTTNLVVPAIIESLEPSTKVDDAGRVSVTAQSTGSFVACIV